MTQPHLDARQLFVEHAAFVASFALRLGMHPAEIDDVVQEVFLIVHRKGGFTPEVAAPRTWLAAITIRHCRGRRRSVARRREDLQPDAGADQVHAQTPERRTQTEQAMAQVQRALDMLDFDHRSVFVLYEIEGESCAAIAQALGIPVGTVYSRLHHARERFLRAHNATGLDSVPLTPVPSQARPL